MRDELLEEKPRSRHYAFNRYHMDWSQIRTRHDVAAVLNTSEKRIRYLLYGAKVREQYTVFHIPKKRGGTRAISAPPKILKTIQRRIADLLTNGYRAKSCNHGFLPKRSIVTNALTHVGKPLILNIDLEDFFPSIYIGRFIGCLTSPAFSMGKQAAEVLAQFCFDSNGKLPQGAPTSPIVSNIVCWNLDDALLALAKRFHVQYSRYADDLTFSTTKPVFPSEIVSATQHGVMLGSPLQDAITQSSFRINVAKLRLQTRRVRQVVTGLTVNEKPNLQRLHIRQLDSILHSWRKFGMQRTYARFAEATGAPSSVVSSSPKYLIRHVQGKLAYLQMVKGKNDPVFRRLQWGFHNCEPNHFALPPDLCSLVSVAVTRSHHSFCGWNRFAAAYAAGIKLIEIKEKGDTNAATGFVVTDHQLITAGHVAAAKGAIHVWLNDQQTLQPTYRVYINSPGGVDIAILGFSDPVFSNMPHLPLLLRLPEIGEPIAACGYPRLPFRECTQVLHAGHVEAIPKGYRDSTVFIQTSFQSGGGLSGSPLLDQNGCVLGVMIENVFLEEESVDQARARERRVAPHRPYGQAMPIEYSYVAMQQLHAMRLDALRDGGWTYENLQTTDPRTER